MPGHSKQLRRSATSSDLLCDDDEPEFFTADFFQGPRGRTKNESKRNRLNCRMVPLASRIFLIGATMSFGG